MTDAEVAERYQHMSPVEHVLLRPDMYIGSCQHVPREVFIAQEGAAEAVTAVRIAKKQIQHVPGLIRLFEEAILNAFDQTVRANTGCTEIRVDVDVQQGSISVANNGAGIPVVRKDELDCFVPEMIFGMLRTGSNYDDSDDSGRLTGGKFGLGIKLANIFSTSFTLDTVDEERGKRYVQTWAKNMSAKSDHSIKACRRKGRTRVTFVPDLTYFRLAALTPDLVMLMKKRLVDIGFASHAGVRTYFNGEQISIKRPESYMRLYANPEGAKLMVDDSCERWTVGVVRSDSGFQHASFVNGIHTTLGGSHVDHVVNQVCKVIVEKLATQRITVRPSDVKNRMFVFVCAAIESPAFDSQSKEALRMERAKFGSEFVMSDAFRKKLAASDIARAMAEVADSRMMKDLVKTSGSKTSASRHLNIPTLEEATRRGPGARLILTEGMSARTFAISALSVIGRERYGVFPLKGKLLNVRNVPLGKVIANEEIQNIAKIVGLRYDCKYELDSDLKSLNYGGLISLTDADADGYHISCLLVNYVHHFWPSLLRRGFVSFCITPIVKVYHRKETLQFYTIHSYDEWVRDHQAETFRTKYFKGLGTSTAAEAREALKDIDSKLIKLQSDPACDESIRLAFCAKRADDRKRWLMEDYDPGACIDRGKREVAISDFINYELSHFSVYDCARSIPNIMDGLKPSQRKIMFVARKFAAKADMKVGQLGPKVSELTDYHHGEQSLTGAIVAMAQTFVGSNNLNLLVPQGGFGCLDPTAMVLLHGGGMCKAREVSRGDRLVGDDGAARTVLRLTCGVDDMFLVIVRGAGPAFKVNSQHKLTLVDAPGLEDDGADIPDAVYANAVDVNVVKFMSWPAATRLRMRAVVASRKPGGRPLSAHALSVAHAGVGAFTGWELDGNHRFQLQGRVVTHNSRLSGGADAAAPRYIFTRLNPVAGRIFDARDDSLLEHLSSDGVDIEPRWFAPVLPMIVINGALGIGTGFSTSVLQYNPRDVAAYILAKLPSPGGGPAQTVAPVAPQPWYRGFTGTIEQTAPGKYTTYGVWAFDDKAKSLRVSELPINMWTDTYKSFCVKFLEQSKDLVKDVRYNNTDTIVDIAFVFKTAEAYAQFKAISRADLAKRLHLSSKLSATNMFLFNADGCIQRFDTVCDIIDQYYDRRLKLYARRKEALLARLSSDMLVADNKHRFIRAVKSGTIDQASMTCASLFRALEQSFDEDPKREKAAEGLARYRYLTDMPIQALTNENAEKMRRLVESTQQGLRVLQATIPADMWRNDIDDILPLLEGKNS